jgi:hypothetical protein
MIVWISLKAYAHRGCDLMKLTLNMSTEDIFLDSQDSLPMVLVLLGPMYNV